METSNPFYPGPSPLKTKVVPIGNWDMNAVLSVDVAHGLAVADIRSVDVVIINDAGDGFYMLDYPSLAAKNSGRFYTDTDNVVLTRFNGEFFDDVAFDTAVFNRGFVTIWYV